MARKRQPPRDPVSQPVTPALFLVAAGILLVGLPLVFQPGGFSEFRLPKLWWFQAFAGLSIAGWLLALAFGEGYGRAWQRLRVDPVFLGLAGLAALALASMVVKSGSLLGGRQVACLLLGAGLYAAVRCSFACRDLRRLATLFLIPAAITGAIAVLQYYGWFFGSTALAGKKGAASALIGHASTVGALLAMAAPLAVVWLLGQKQHRWPMALATGLIVVGLIYSFSLGAYGAVVCGLLFLGWALGWRPGRPSGRMVVFLLVGAAVLGLVLWNSHFASVAARRFRKLAHGDWQAFSNYRLELWRAALWLLASAPFLGIGVGAYPVRVHDALGAIYAAQPAAEVHKHPSVLAAHNEFLEVGAELGLPGLIVVFGGLGLFLWRFIQVRRACRQIDQPAAEQVLAFRYAAGLAAGLAGLAVDACTHFPLRLAATATAGIFFAALCQTALDALPATPLPWPLRRFAGPAPDGSARWHRYAAFRAALIIALALGLGLLGNGIRHGLIWNRHLAVGTQLVRRGVEGQRDSPEARLRFLTRGRNSLRLARQHVPDDGETDYYLGLANLYLGAGELALDAFKRAERSYRRAELHYARGKTLERFFHDREGASRELERALYIKPDHEDAKRELKRLRKKLARDAAKPAKP